MEIKMIQAAVADAELGVQAQVTGQDVPQGTDNEPSSVPAPSPRIAINVDDEIAASYSIPELPDIPDILDAPDLKHFTASELYDMNQQLLDNSVPQRPLIDEIAPMSRLREEYENGSPSFLAQIDWLTQQGYDHIRRARGDGDCFYRSLAFAYAERILDTPASDRELALVSAMSVLETTLSTLEVAGFQKLVFEDFYDTFMSLIRRIAIPELGKPLLTVRSLLESFQDPETSNAIVVYLRLLTSAQIRLNPDSYAPFLFDAETGISLEPREFCERSVEATGKEADHVQISALSSALKLNIDIAYLDGRGQDGRVDFVEFRNAPDSATEPLRLLYRPGHYDILMKKTLAVGAVSLWR